MNGESFNLLTTHILSSPFHWNSKFVTFVGVGRYGSTEAVTIASHVTTTGVVDAFVIEAGDIHFSVTVLKSVRFQFVTSSVGPSSPVWIEAAGIIDSGRVCTVLMYL